MQKGCPIEIRLGNLFLLVHFGELAASKFVKNIEMEIKGKVVQLLPLQTGAGKNGTWKKQDFVIETDGQYPKKVCISAWGDKVGAESLQVGKDVNVSFDVESREYNGKWYTDLKAWKLDTSGEGSGGESYAGGEPAAAFPPMTTFSADEDNALPF